MTSRTAEQQAVEASERRTELPERLVDSIRRHGSEALMIAARVTKQRLDDAQKAREKRELHPDVIPGANANAAEAMRARIAKATRDRRLSRDAEAGRELQKRRWVDTQLGGNR